MKKSLLFFLGAFFFVLSGFSQENVLLLQKKSSSKEKVINEGKKIRVYTTDDNILKGKITIHGDSALVFNGDTVLLEDIAKIRTKSLATQIFGGTLAGLGGLTTLAGGMIWAQAMADGGWAVLVGVMFGIPVTSVGVLATTTGVIFLTVGKKYRSKKWDYRIKQL